MRRQRSDNVYDLTGCWRLREWHLPCAPGLQLAQRVHAPRAGSYGNHPHGDFGSLDFSVVWQAMDPVGVKLDVNNLQGKESARPGNNAEPTSGSGFTAGFPLNEYETARRVNLGVSARF
ncbi:hypothetical protein [Microbulbifer guangxiensis]|uniref:hypothetical protein n=1 Tax=Microbulbifer guangxiensis TaxID=2904249 RepID=UPI001F491061|nr:hypothetical protein [Microbulbifer guangxiensis]